MIITDLIKVPRKAKYDVYVDGELFCTLSDVGIINCGIKIGAVFEEIVLRSLVDEAINADAFETLLNILGQTALTEQIARQKLKQKGYSDESVTFSVDKAIAYGYINDREYACSFIEHTTAKSKLRIIADLQKKGIDKYLFDRELNDYDEQDACINAMRSSIKRELNEEEQKKLFQRFYMQGFPFQIIKNAYSEIVSEL